MLFRTIYRLVVLVIFAIPAFAENFTLTATTTNGVVSVDGGGLVNGGTKTIQSPPIQIELKCADAATCNGLSVQFGGKELCKASGTGCLKTITPTDLGAGGDLVVQNSQNKAIFTTTLTAAGTGSGASVGLEKKDLLPLLRTPCTFDKSGSYDRDKNLAVFVVDVFGNVHSGPGEAVDENDTVRVIVFADERLQPFLHVFRKSSIRTSGTINIAGSGLTLSLPTDPRHGLTAAQCVAVSFDLDSFAPGTGVVQIDVQTDQGPQTLGSFDFDVHKLYSGIISFGVTHGDLADSTFKLTTQGDKKLIYASEDGQTSTEYAMFLTGFFSQRDLEKAPQGPLDIVGATIGFATSKPSQRAFVGLSVNWRLLVLTAGEEFAQVTTLSKASGLHEGDPFTGTEAEIPTMKRWKHGRFYAVSMDLRAVTQFFSTFGGGGGGAK